MVGVGVKVGAAKTGVLRRGIGVPRALNREVGVGLGVLVGAAVASGVLVPGAAGVIDSVSAPSPLAPQPKDTSTTRKAKRKSLATILLLTGPETRIDSTLSQGGWRHKVNPAHLRTSTGSIKNKVSSPPTKGCCHRGPWPQPILNLGVYAVPIFSAGSYPLVFYICQYA